MMRVRVSLSAQREGGSLSSFLRMLSIIANRERNRLAADCRTLSTLTLMMRVRVSLSVQREGGSLSSFLRMLSIIASRERNRLAADCRTLSTLTLMMRVRVSLSAHKNTEALNLGIFMAQREGFEPSVRFTVHTISNRAP